MTLVRFKHDVSLLVGDGRLDFYTSEGGHDWYFLEGANEASEAVNLSEGLVHVQTRDGVYQIRSDSDAGFVIQRITP